MFDRTHTTFDKNGESTIRYIDVDWVFVRNLRNEELRATDHWALKDRRMSQAKKDYREMLRTLPQSFENANQAIDYWFAYEKPED